MLPSELTQYKPLFLQTALENIRILETNLIALTKNPTDQQAIDTLHICSHSLKGQSLMMRYEQIGNASYAMERLFYLVKHGQHTLTAADIQTLTAAVKEMKIALADIAAHDYEKNLAASTASIQAMLSRIATP